MTELPNGCDREIYERRFADNERRLDELAEHYRVLDHRTAEQGGLIKSIDGRMTDLVKDTTAQTIKLDQTVGQNDDIIRRVELLDNTMTDSAQNGAEATRQIKAVQETVTTLDDGFKRYVEKNAKNMKVIETAGDGIVRIETFLGARWNDMKLLGRRLYSLGLLLLALWTINHFFPGLKSLLAEAVHVGGLAE